MTFPRSLAALALPLFLLSLPSAGGAQTRIAAGQTSIITLPGYTALKTMLIAGFDSEGPGSGPAICSAEAVATRTLMGFGARFG